MSLTVGEVLKEILWNSEIKNVRMSMFEDEDTEFNLYTNTRGEPIDANTNIPAGSVLAPTIGVFDVNGVNKERKYKRWIAKKGPLNITLDSQGNFTQIVPQEIEKSGGYKPTVGSKKLTDKFDSSRYQSKTKQYSDDFFGSTSIGDRSLEAQKLIKNGNIVDNLNTDDNTYKKFIGYYNIFSDGSFVVYKGGKFNKDPNRVFGDEPAKITTKIGRTFEVSLSNNTAKQLIESGVIKPSDSTPSNNSSTQPTLDAQSIEKKVVIQKELTLFAHI